MTSNTDFYTATMAKIYADQGHFDKAVEIYRYLLKGEPDRPELIEALAEVEVRALRKQAMGGKDLGPLLGEWLDLLLKYKNIQKLKKLTKGKHSRAELE